MESNCRTNSRSVVFDNKLIATVLACRQSTSTRIKVHFTTASLNWLRSGMTLTERAWSCLGTLTEKKRDCLWIIAARRKRKCAKSFGKSRKMFQGHQAHFRAQSNLISLYTRVKTLSTTCWLLMQSSIRTWGTRKGWISWLELSLLPSRTKSWLFPSCRGSCRASNKPKRYRMTFWTKWRPQIITLPSSLSGASSTLMAWKS